MSADKKISQLDAVASLSSNDLFAVVSSNITKKITFPNLQIALANNTYLNKNDGSNTSVPTSRNIIEASDIDTGVLVGKLLVGQTNISTDYIGFAFYGFDDYTGIGGAPLFLGGFSGYGTLAVAGNIVTNYNGHLFDNAGNYFPDMTYIGYPLPTDGNNPGLAQLHVRYNSETTNGAPTNLLSLAKEDGSIVLKVAPNGETTILNVTKVQRNNLTAIPGTIVYQTDNTPGLRTYNGTHWVRYTETNDD